MKSMVDLGKANGLSDKEIEDRIVGYFKWQERLFCEAEQISELIDILKVRGSRSNGI